MTTRLPTLLLLTVFALIVAGCGAAPPRTLRYIAVTPPPAVAPTPEQPMRRVEVSHTRVLPNIRLPVDVAAFLTELEQKAGTPVLRNADLKLTTSICCLLCINTDTASADAPR